MAAAKMVNDAGLTVAVLEASSRVGGRTWSDQAVGGAVDYGGMYIGETHDQLIDLGRSLGLEMAQAGQPGSDVYLIDGKAYAAPEGVLPQTVPFAAELDQSFRTLDDLAVTVGWEAPWAAAAAAELDKISVSTWLDANFADRRVRRVHEMAVTAVLGADAAEVSMLYWAYFIAQCDGYDQVMARSSGAQDALWLGGAGQIAERIAEKLNGQIHLDQPAIRVEHSADRVRVHAATLIAEGRSLIVAMAPNAADRINFQPALPPARRQLQMRAPMGRMTKILVRFPTAFWAERGFSGGIVDCDHLGADIFEGTRPGDSHATLIGFIGGSFLDAWVRLSPEQRRTAYLQVLADAFGELPAPPSYFHEIDWTEQTFVKGAPTTVMPPGVLASAGAALRESVGIIRFAGTEASLKWSGYMEGAVRAGRTAAESTLAGLRGEPSGQE